MAGDDRARASPDIPDIQATVLQTTLQQVSSESEKDCCVICLGEITEACEAQPCGHRYFDYICLLTWLEERKTCPLCNTNVGTVHYDFSLNRQRWKTHVPASSPPAASQAPPDRTYNQLRYENSRYARTRFPRGRAHQDGGRHAHGEGRSPPRAQSTRTCQASGPLARRRFVYRNQLYSLHVGSNRLSRYRELTPQSFNTDQDLVSRARMFLRRELQVFEFLSPGGDGENPNTSSPGSSDPSRLRRANNAEFLLEYIVAILKTVDMQGSSGQAEELIRDFVGRENARLLLHELRAWLRSPHLSLEAWDRAVQYPEMDKGLRVRRHPLAQPAERRASRFDELARRRRRGPVRNDIVTSDVVYPSTWRREDGL